MRNTYKYTQLYSGQNPLFEEGDIFRTIIPLKKIATQKVGGNYDDRFLVKPDKSAIAYMPNAKYELPHDGAKEMLLVDDVDNKDFLTGFFDSMYDELPVPKLKKMKNTRI